MRKHGGGKEQVQESKDPGLLCDSYSGHPFPFHHLALSLEIHCPHCKKRSEYYSLIYVLLISYVLSTFFCCLSFFVTSPFHSKFISFIAKTWFCNWTKLHSSHDLSNNTTQIIQEVGHIFFRQIPDMSVELIKKSLHNE
jgi:hypothetical protein